RYIDPGAGLGHREGRPRTAGFAVRDRRPGHPGDHRPGQFHRREDRPSGVTPPRGGTISLEQLSCRRLCKPLTILIYLRLRPRQMHKAFVAPICQRWPNGSLNMAKRSPQNMSCGSWSILTPIDLALATSASTCGVLSKPTNTEASAGRPPSP